MNRLKLLLIGLTALSGIVGMANGSSAVEKVCNCYFGTWANYRDGDGAFTTDHIDPFLCTHISYAFFGINDSGAIKSLDTWLDFDLGHIKKTIALKEKNPILKVIAVIGGWNEGSAKYSSMAASPEKRQTFISSVLTFLKEHGFDGMDLDWEYPARREGANPKDKENFVILLKELNTALKASNYLLGIAVGATEETAKSSYDIPNIVKYVDFVNLMTYDFHTSADRVAGANAALEGSGQNTVKYSVNYWLQQGCPANKLILGLPFYGHTFKLQNPQQARLGASAVGAGKAGPYTKTEGFLGYNEYCVNAHQWTSKWSAEEQVPYSYKENELFSYDDSKSIALKVKFANSLGLGGCMIWSIETDDFRGRCGTKYPLLKTINIELGRPQDMSSSGNELPQGSSSVDQTHPSVATSTSPKLDDNGICREDGFYSDASDCSRYHRCVAGTRHDLGCPSGLHFDVSTSTCNWPDQVQC